MERHWLLDRGRGRLGMDLGNGSEALNRACHGLKLWRPGNTGRHILKRKFILRR